MLSRRAMMNDEIVSEQGKNLVLQKCKGSYLHGMKVYGHTTQQTTTGAQLLDIDSMLNNHLIKNDDGSYSILKTETNRFSNPLPVNLSAGTTIRFDANIIDYNGTYDKPLQISIGNQTINVAQSITLNSDITSLRIYQDGYNPVGTYTKFKNAMLSIGTTALPWEPYTGGTPSPSPEYPQEIVSTGDKGSIETRVTGKNLIPFPYKDKSKTQNGVTMTVNDDGTILYNGTATNAVSFYIFLGDFRLIPGQVYTISDAIAQLNGILNNNIVHGIPYTAKDGDYISVFWLWHPAGEVFDNRLFKPQFERSTGITEFESPRTPQTLTLSTPNGLPGIPVSSGGNYTDENGQQWVADYRDWERGVDVQRIGTHVYDGTEAFTKAAADKPWFYYNVMPDAYKEGVRANVSCTHFQRGILGWGIETYGEVMINMSNIIFSWYSDKTADDFKEMLAAQYEAGTPVTIQYILATPIETPIPAEELAAYQLLHTNTPTTTIVNDEDCWMEVTHRRLRG